MFLVGSNASAEEIVTTTGAAKNKKESQSIAAERMLKELEERLGPYIHCIAHKKRLKDLKSKKSQKNQIYQLHILHGMFENLQPWLEKLIRSNPEQWIPVKAVMNWTWLVEFFGRRDSTDVEYREIKDIFIELVQTHSDILEISDDLKYLRRKQLYPHIVLQNPQKSQELNQKGNDSFRACMYQDALQYYLDAWNYNQCDEKCAMNLSLCYLKLSEYDNALTFARKAIEIKPRFSKPHARAAAALFAKRRISQALLNLRNAIQRAPNNGEYARLYQEWENIRQRQKQQQLQTQNKENEPSHCNQDDDSKEEDKQTARKDHKDIV